MNLVLTCVSLHLLGFQIYSRNTLEFPTNTAKPRPRPGANNGSLAASQATILQSSFLSPGIFLHDSWPQECSLPETTVWVVACLCSIFFFFNQKEWEPFFSPVRKTICLSYTQQLPDRTNIIKKLEDPATWPPRATSSLTGLCVYSITAAHVCSSLKLPCVDVTGWLLKVIGV